ncbi:NERD domain-containing protein [Neobacillus sp. SM06]|uniref:nuclease-related domain-containing protein n=1 Tax=Neobacillus sp. SM06 TaxID=3422492 RepID=UPI003D278A59
MILKERKESLELRKMRSLRARMKLSVQDERHYLNLEKGYQGELIFDKLLRERLQKSWPVANDLLLATNHTHFQIDSLIFSHEPIYLFDVKNFEGDFFIEGDKWYSIVGDVVKNPYHQLQRAEALLRRLLRNYGYSPPIQSYLIFVNPDFYLYNAPLNHPFIFPTQINRFFKSLNLQPANGKNEYLQIANQLLSLHIEDSPFTQVPAYTYNGLRKGMTCLKCGRFVVMNEKEAVCLHCGTIESLESAVLRSVMEYRILFPERKTTMAEISDWCEFTLSAKTLRRILKSTYVVVGRGTYACYQEK